jgi:hypothetical protein
LIGNSKWEIVWLLFSQTSGKERWEQKAPTMQSETSRVCCLRET